MHDIPRIIKDSDTWRVPQGPFTFEKWVDDSSKDDDALKLSAVWKNAKGEKYSMLLSCMNDILCGKVSPQTKLYQSGNGEEPNLIPSFPENEINICVSAYSLFMMGRNRSDATTKVISKGPFSAP